MTSGGIMYHDVGFAGLPEVGYPTTSSDSGQKLHIGTSGQREFAHGCNDALSNSPLSIPSALLLKQIHTLPNA